jgi:hypothetical protein
MDVVQAQPRLVFETLPTSGPRPYLDMGKPLPSNEIRGFSMDPKGQVAHVVYGNDWYRLDLRSGTWTAHPIRNGFDLENPRWGVVPGRTELLAWDVGLGRVVRIDSTGEPTRIDRSFNQKTQYGHIQHIGPDGRITAIGGTGLHHPKNYAVAFSHASMGWHRYGGSDLISHDPFVADGFSLHDPVTGSFLIFAAHRYHSWQVDRGILQMDPNSGRIRILHTRHPSVTSAIYENYVQHNETSVQTGSHRIGFVQQRGFEAPNNMFRLSAISLDSYRVVELQGPLASDIHPATEFAILHYSDSDSILYSLEFTHHTNDFISGVVAHRAKVDVEALQSHLERGRVPDMPLREPADGAAPVWPWQLALGIALLGMGGLWMRARGLGERILPGPAVTPQAAIRIRLDPLRVNGTDWKELFGSGFTMEGRLLENLARAALDGRPVVNSETVERLLTPSHPSVDYIRKTRNQTRKRLEESLQAIRPLPDGEAYVLTDRDITDKRKSRLQLNSRWITVNPPG